MKQSYVKMSSLEVRKLCEATRERVLEHRRARVKDYIDSVVERTNRRPWRKILGLKPVTYEQVYTWECAAEGGDSVFSVIYGIESMGWATLAVAEALLEASKHGTEMLVGAQDLEYLT